MLVEGDDFNEPICDAARGILDGHLILSRDLASAGHYPAIDVLSSVSRLANKVATKEETQAAQKIREALALYQRSADLIQLGAHVQGTNPKLDQSIRLRPQISEFLRQDAEAHSPLDETKAGLFGAGETTMTTFRFPLERVLDWRKLQMRAEEEKLAALQHRLDTGEPAHQRALGAAELKSESGLRKLTSVAGSELQTVAAFQTRVKKHRAALGARTAAVRKAGGGAAHPPVESPQGFSRSRKIERTPP